MSLASFKEQWMRFSVYCHCIFSNHGWISITAVTAVSYSNGCRFAHIITALFQKKSGSSFSYVVATYLKSSRWISKQCHYCFTKQWMWFSTHCHCSFSKSSRFNLLCVVTAHLLSSGWIFLRCHCSLSKGSGCCFHCVVTAHSAVDIFP